MTIEQQRELAEKRRLLLLDPLHTVFKLLPAQLNQTEKNLARARHDHKRTDLELKYVKEKLELEHLLSEDNRLIKKINEMHYTDLNKDYNKLFAEIYKKFRKYVKPQHKHRGLAQVVLFAIAFSGIFVARLGEKTLLGFFIAAFLLLVFFLMSHREEKFVPVNP